jgi:hypothetical protein
MNRRRLERNERRMTHLPLRRQGAALTLSLAALAAGCAGSGEGLDQNGRPIGEDPGGPASDFAEIQDTVFTPICTACHAGATAPLGLRLDAANSYALLVGVPSVQVPSLQRVNPGDVDASYLVRKIEGTASVGGRMPLGGPALSQDRIDLIKQWIAAGAPADDAEAVMPPAPLQVVSTIPDQGERFQASDVITLIFNADVDASLVGPDAVSLSRIATNDGAASNSSSDNDNDNDNDNEPTMSIARIEVQPYNASVVKLRPAEPLPAGSYRLILRTDASPSLASNDGRLLDGDGDGRAGGDHTLEFSVTEPAP